MQAILPSLDVLFLGLPGHYSVALITLLLCVLIALYFANFFKDKTELEDEGLGADEPRDEEDSESRTPQGEETDDDEAYEENSTESEVEFIEEQLPGHNYNHLMGQLKAKRLQHKMEKALTPGQIEEERRIEREQLAAIFDLLRRQEAELNLQDRISDQELKQQVRLYR
ncbi:matrix-remodeling-associated protein 7 [Drosophila suzukii]|uniref:Matrix-remodeling-associated protein 7 n=1 Tax=Drosophila suzukii TaxID=28584 RepID=A0AB39ZP44_DROSZ|nr:matrix-remodeling-associated protein 7 [Drosophila subpulchrella]